MGRACQLAWTVVSSGGGLGWPSGCSQGGDIVAVMEVTIVLGGMVPRIKDCNTVLQTELLATCYTIVAKTTAA